MALIDTVVSIAVVGFFLLFVYAGITKQTIQEVFTQIMNLIKRKPKSAQQILNEAEDFGKQSWSV